MKRRLAPATAAGSVIIVVAVLAGPARAGLESGAYQTLPGATAEESGDRVANSRRVVPLAATITFDLSAAEPSVTAIWPNAVLEGGAPFPLTVRSLSGARFNDGTFRFMGDYLLDLYPSGTQYLFDWQFTTAADGRLVWNGANFWAGGHLWQVTISDVTLVPQARLTISRTESSSLRIMWATNFADHVLETATRLPAEDWSAVTNSPAMNGDRLCVTVESSVPQRFYRLRKR